MSTSQQWLELVQGAGALFGSYLQEALASKFARVLPNNVCLLPDDKVKSSLLIVEKISNLLFCHTCDDGSILNLKDQTNVNKEHCTHTFVANTLMENSDKTSFDVADKDNIFVVQENPYYVAVVYPSKERQDSKLRPGVIMKTARMTKTRCRTCKGRDNCFHLNVLKQAETEKAANENCRSGRLAEQAKKKTNVETDMLGGLAYKKENPKGKSKSKNENNPENFHGDAANVFGQQFQYPPTTADKEKNNKINKVREQKIGKNTVFIKLPPPISFHPSYSTTLHHFATSVIDVFF